MMSFLAELRNRLAFGSTTMSPLTGLTFIESDQWIKMSRSLCAVTAIGFVSSLALVAAGPCSPRGCNRTAPA